MDRGLMFHVVLPFLMYEMGGFDHLNMLNVVLRPRTRNLRSLILKGLHFWSPNAGGVSGPLNDWY